MEWEDEREGGRQEGRERGREGRRDGNGKVEIRKKAIIFQMF